MDKKLLHRSAPQTHKFNKRKHEPRRKPLNSAENDPKRNHLRNKGERMHKIERQNSANEHGCHGSLHVK